MIIPQGLWVFTEPPFRLSAKKKKDATQLWKRVKNIWKYMEAEGCFRNENLVLDI